MAKAIPISGRVLRRQRLFALLDGAGGRGIWICGPPGVGKTMLASSWIEARRIRCLWYRVQPGDADLASFFYEVGSRAGPRRAPLPAFTPEYRGGEAAFARRFVRDLAPTRGRPWALVLDELHQVASPQPLFAVLGETLQDLPPWAKLVFVSRAEPPDALARLVAEGALSVVGGEELQLTDAEALAIARAHAPRKAPEELRRMCQRAAGWAAGLVLLATSPPGPAGAPLEPSALFRYLGSELLDRADPETRRILMDAAIPPLLPAGIAAALCASERALALLEDLARRAYFVARRGREDPVFELHPLARELLLERARAERPPERLRDLEKRAAGLLAEAGRVEDALDLYARAEAWGDVARTALAEAPRLIATGRVAKLAGWLDAIPMAFEDQDPWLSYWHGTCHLFLDPAAARRHLARAWAGFDAAGDVAGLHLAFAAAIDSFMCEWADLKRMDEWINRFEEVVGRRPAVPDPLVAQRSIAAMFTALTIRRLWSDVLPGLEARALGIVGDVSLPPSTRLAMGTFLVIECAFRGDGTRATHVVRTLAPLVRAARIDPVTAIGWLTAEAVYDWHAGAPSKSIGAANLGLAVARQSGVHAWDCRLREQRVLASLAAGDLGTARKQIAAIRASSPIRTPLQRGNMGQLEVLLALHEGDAARAVSLARALVEIREDIGVGFAEVLGPTYLALALVEAGDGVAARPQLELLRRAGAAARSALAEMVAELAEAELARRSGDLAAARVHLEHGLRVSRENGIVPDVWFSRDRLAGLCALALDSGIETKHALGLVRRLELVAPAGCCSERWPWTLRVHLFGPLEVIVRGKALRFATKAQRRPLDVLQALVAGGAPAQSGKALAAALWPESDGDLSHHALETATWRLRRLVGDKIVRHREGRLHLDTGRCWVDALAFRSLLARAAACLQRRDAPGALAAAEAAIALYRGPFLADREEPWALAARARHRAHLRRCLSDLEALGGDPKAARRLRARTEAADPEAAGPSRSQN